MKFTNGAYLLKKSQQTMKYSNLKFAHDGTYIRKEEKRGIDVTKTVIEKKQFYFFLYICSPSIRILLHSDYLQALAI
jgi:hypothetical protein